MSEQAVPATPEVQLPDNFDAMTPQEFNKWRETGELPKAEAEPKTESSEASEEEAKTEPESETGKQEGDEEPHPDELTKKGLAKRFSKLTQARREAEAKAAELERKLAEIQGSRPAQETAKPAAEGEPKLDDFETFEQYTRALARWEARQLLESERKKDAETKQQAQVKATLDNWNQRVAEFASKHDDYGDLVDSLPPLPTTLQRAVIESDAGPELAYHLAKPENHEQLDQLIAAASDVQKLNRIVGRIEAAIVKPPEPKKQKVSAAPEPIKPVSSTKAKTFDPMDPNASFSDWEKWRNAQLRNR